MAEPEASIISAYSSGRTAAQNLGARTSNPFLSDGTYVGQTKARAWFAGYDGEVSDMTNRALSQNAPLVYRMLTAPGA